VGGGAWSGLSKEIWIVIPFSAELDGLFLSICQTK
jgi:hypothetical protein